MSWRGELRKAGANVTVRNNGVRDWEINGMLRASNIGDYPRVTYYVDRNMSASGDGLSFTKAFKTIGEAITQVNTDYTDADSDLAGAGRNRRIVIGEGWYSEVGMTLTASDVEIIGAAPGSRDNVVLWGSATAGGWDAGAVVPVLTVTGSNNTIRGMSFVNSASGLYPCVQVGGLAAAAYANLFIDCDWPRSTADMYTYSLQVYDLEGTRIQGCEFSQSAKTAGIHIESDGVINPVNVRIIGNIFVGTPIGIHQVAGHNTIITDNWFIDSTDDRTDTIDNPCNIGATSAFMMYNTAPMNTLAEFNGGAVGVELANVCSDSDDENWPAT